jgi:hypothetical protein
MDKMKTQSVTDLLFKEWEHLNGLLAKEPAELGGESNRYLDKS